MATYFNKNKLSHIHHRGKPTGNFTELNKLYYKNVQVFSKIEPYYFVKSNVQQVNMSYSGSVTVSGTSSGLRLKTGEAWAFKNCIVFTSNLLNYIGKGYYLRLSASQGLTMFGQSHTGEPNNPPPTGTWISTNTDIPLDSVISALNPYLGIKIGDNKDIYIYDLYIHN